MADHAATRSRCIIQHALSGDNLVTGRKGLRLRTRVSILWHRRIEGCHRYSSHGRYGSLPLAWMPNGAAVVARQDYVGGQWTHQFDLTIDGLSGARSTAVVHFPSWISNPHARPIARTRLSQAIVSADGKQSSSRPLMEEFGSPACRGRSHPREPG